jgi:hypothetical protein
MTINFKKMCSWEQEKAQYLCRIVILKNFPIDGLIDVNPNSGYVYYWHEDLNFCLYMPISCDLSIEDIWVMYSCPETGEETEIQFAEFENKTNVIRSIENWIESITK